MYYIADGYSLISHKLLIFRQCGLIEDILNKIAYVVREMCDRILGDNFISKDMVVEGSKKYGLELSFNTSQIASLYEIRLPRPSIPTLITDELNGIIDAQFQCAHIHNYMEIYYGFPITHTLNKSEMDDLFDILDCETGGDDNQLFYTNTIDYRELIGIVLDFQEYTFEQLESLFNGVKAEDYKDVIINAKIRLLGIIENHELPIEIIGLPMLILIFD